MLSISNLATNRACADLKVSQIAGGHAQKLVTFYDLKPSGHGTAVWHVVAPRVTWVYSFGLKDDVFAGSLGAPGRFLFQRDYAAMMHGVLNGYKRKAEQQGRTAPARAYCSGPFAGHSNLC